MKALSLCSGAKSNFRDRVLGEVEKNSFIALPGKGGHGSLLLGKTACLQPGGYLTRSSRGGVANKIRVCGGPGLRWSGLLILMSFSGPFNLASSSFLTAPL